MSSRSSKKYNKNQKTHKRDISRDISSLEMENNSNSDTFKFTPAEKHIVDMPSFEGKFIDTEYINEQQEDTYEDTSKYVSVDRMRLKNINDMLNNLNKEFAELSKDSEDGRNTYSVNKSYYNMKNTETLKKIDSLN